MKVTTGRISVGVGTLIVGALSVAGVLTVRDENNNPTPADEAECQPQTSEVARAASEAFQDEYVRSGRDISSATGSLVVSSDAVRDLLEEARDAGNPVTDPVPEWSENGWVLVVDADPPEDGSAAPTCFDDTPILYVGSGASNRAG